MNNKINLHWFLDFILTYYYLNRSDQTARLLKLNNYFLSIIIVVHLRLSNVFVATKGGKRFLPFFFQSAKKERKKKKKASLRKFYIEALECFWYYPVCK